LDRVETYTYFMAVIDDVFSLDVRVIYRRQMRFIEQQIRSMHKAQQTSSRHRAGSSS